MTIINVVFLIISFILLVLSFLMKKRGDKPLNDKAYYLFFALAIILSIAVRLASFSSIPGGVNQDEAMAAVDARALAEYGTDRLGMIHPVHLQAWGFGQMSALLSYLMIPFIKILGFSTFSIRLPMLILSLVGLMFLYLFAKDLFNRDLALVVLLFGAICPWHIVQSRWAIDCNTFPHMLIIALYLLHHGIKMRRIIHVYFSMVFFALAMYGYGISIYSVPIFLFLTCFYLILSRKVKVSSALICLAIYLLISWPFFAMIFINTFDLKPIETSFFTIPYFSETIRKADILFFSDNFFLQLWQNILATVRVLFQIGNDYMSNVVPGFSTMYVFTVPFSLYGYYYLSKNFHKNAGMFILLLFFNCGLFSCIITNNVNVNRANLLMYPLIIMNAIGVFRVIKNVKFADIGIELMFVTAFTLFCCSYFTTYKSEISELFFEDFGKAVEDINPDDYDKIFITPDVQSKGRWYVSEVLTLYYHDVDSKYYQSSDFNKKYCFKNPSNSLVESNKDAAFVFQTQEANLFDEADFEVIRFGDYSIALPKQ